VTAIEVQDLVKTFNGLRAVDGLSLEVGRGEIFGLLGPNGAGKTTTIRIMMGIFRPDEGAVRVLGKRPGMTRRRIGYLPEERGLYRDMKVGECLAYLAALKGVDRSHAAVRSGALLASVGLGGQAQAKVKTLSRGMQQKLQFVATVLHDPEVIILDEPFQGLDPISTEQIMELITGLREEGKAIVLSSHSMNQVERLCDRILLINQGKRVLYGPLEEIKARHAPHTVRLRTRALLGALPGVARIERRESTFTLVLEGITPQDLLRTLVERDIPVEAFEVATAPLEDVFISVVKGEAYA
jgi:ABC-2 type transport system ATP-binding protein